MQTDKGPDKRYLFIVNPASGAGRGRIIAELLAKLLPDHPRLGDGRVEIALIDRVNSSELKEKLSQVETAVAVGGDGTVSHLIPHLLACERPPAIGVIPLGTSNDLARTLGVSVKCDYTREDVLLKTIDILSHASKETLDVFSVNDNLFFCNYFSLGFDAAIVRDFDAFRGSRLAKALPAGRLTNNLLYFLIGLKNARFRLAVPMEIECVGEGGSQRLTLNTPRLAIIASNLPVYAGGCRIAPEARKDDGIFEITVVSGILDYIRLILTRFMPFLDPPIGLERCRGREATISLLSHTPSQIDGEKCLAVDNSPQKLTISHRASLPVLAAGPRM